MKSSTMYSNTCFRQKWRKLIETKKRLKLISFQTLNKNKNNDEGLLLYKFFSKYEFLTAHCFNENRDVLT